MQTELFGKFAAQGYERIAGGCYGQVYAKDNEWIVKRARNDGTRTFLEWVLLKTARGERMQGMPELDFVVAITQDSGHLGEYIVAMRRYISVEHRLQKDFRFESYAVYSCYKDPKCPRYVSELIDAFVADCPAVSANDIHHGNIMLDERTGDLVVTDPSSSLYRPIGEDVAAFELS